MGIALKPYELTYLAKEFLISLTAEQKELVYFPWITLTKHDGTICPMIYLFVRGFPFRNETEEDRKTYNLLKTYLSESGYDQMVNSFFSN